jgi:Ca2+-binding RTX toxin-like protein
MTVVTAGAFALDMTRLNFDELLDGSVTARTSTTFTVTNDERVDTVTGTGFTYVGDVPVGGTVTGVAETFEGQPAFAVSGFSAPVRTADLFILNGQAVQGLHLLFDGPDTVTGSAFGDRLLTYAGADSLAGGAGDDVLFPGAGPDTATGGAGSDTIVDEGGNNVIFGGDGADLISGGDDFDRINGNAGDDTLAGGRGEEDTVSGGRGNDVLYGDEGQDILNGNLGNDTIAGGDGDDIVRGGQGNDLLIGGSGADTLSGDLGDDTLTGGEGVDVFQASAAGGADRVLEFHASEGDHVQVDPGAVYKVSQVGQDTVIDFGGGNSMTLVGVQLSSLPDGWIFAA